MILANLLRAVIVDALALRVCHGGQVQPISALVAMGISADGHRQVLGLMLGGSESDASWSSLFSWLQGRGPKGVDLAVTGYLMHTRAWKGAVRLLRAGKATPSTPFEGFGGSPAVAIIRGVEKSVRSPATGSSAFWHARTERLGMVRIYRTDRRSKGRNLLAIRLSGSGG